MNNHASSFSSWWPLAVLFLAILVLSASLRLHKCFEWPLAGDEIYTLRNAKIIHPRMDKTQLSLPLYYYCPISFYLAKGVLAISGDDIIGIRFGPLIAGIIVAPITMLLLYRTFGLWLAFASAFLVAINWYHIYLSQFGRFYAIVFLFAALSTWFFFRAIDSKQYRNLWIANFFAVLAVFTHTPAFFLLASQLVFCFFYWWRQDSTASLREQRFLFHTIAATGAVIGFVLALVVPVWTTWQGVSEVQSGYSAVALSFGIADRWGLFLALFSCFALVWSWRTDDVPGIYFGCTAFGPCVFLALASSLGSAVAPGYVAYSFFAAVLLVVRFIDYTNSTLQEAQGRRSCAYLYSAVVLGIALTTAPSLVSHYLDGGRYDFKDICEWIDSNREGGLVVVTASPGMVMYHAQGRKFIAGRRSWSPAESIEHVAEGKVVVMPHKWLAQQDPERLQLAGVELWLIVAYDRQFNVSAPKAVRSYIEKHGVLLYSNGCMRLDHRQNRIGVYRCK